MRKQKKLNYTALVFIGTLMTIVSLTSCSTQVKSNQESSQERIDTGFVVAEPDSYDSADTAVLVEKNVDDKTVTFLNLELGRRYTLSFDGTTGLYDKYKESISLEQIKKGDIVDITFLKNKKHLTTMQLSPQAWRYDNVERYEVNTVRREVSIGSEIYKLTDNTQYLSGGRSIELMDLNAADILSFQGIGNNILSVNVEKGHGYLRLVNDENFVGLKSVSYKYSGLQRICCLR